MRFLFVLCFLGVAATSSSQLFAQAAPDPNVDAARQLPLSLSKVPHDIAFCYGIHNGADFLQMLYESKFARQLTQSETATDLIPESLRDGEINLGIIQFDLSDAAAQTKDAVQGQEADVYNLAQQMLANDAILIGGESWSTTWEAISKSILIAKEHLSLVQGDGDAMTVEGLDHLLTHESMTKIRIPNTVLSFQLTDTAPASRLLAQLSKSADEATPDDLGGWKYHQLLIEKNSLAVFSFKLDEWLRSATNADEADQEQLSEKELAEQKKLFELFRGRSIQCAIGLVESRLVLCVGEDIQTISHLIGSSPVQKQSLIARDEFASVLPHLEEPNSEEMVVAYAYASDRFAKSADALGDEGLLSNLTSLVSNLGGMAKVDDVPVNQFAEAMGISTRSWEQLGAKLKFIGERWDALAAPNAGWAATISASSSGIVGRSVSMSVDPRLPATPLTVNQHVGDDVIAFYARQGTTTAERWLLGYEFLSEMTLGYTKLIMAFVDEDEIDEGVGLHFGRLGQMPMRLTKIVNDSLLPALGDGGQAIVLTRFDPTPDVHDNVPIEFSFVSGVTNRQALADAGEMTRQWANSLVNQYCEIIKKMDPDEADMHVPTVTAPIVAEDGDSSVFTLAAMTLDGDTSSEELPNEQPAQLNTWDLNSLGTIFHWRLSEHVLAIGTNVLVTKQMLAATKSIDSDRGLPFTDGIVRAVTWIDADQIAKLFDGVADEHSQSITETIRCFDSFHKITTTKNGKTIGRWKLSMPLGE